jgi:hypothetical protein
MTRSRQLLLVLVTAVVLLGLGFTWGASGRFSIQNALDEAQQQVALAEARSALLEARVSLYNVNFGDASERYQQVGNNAAAGSITAALEHIEEGQRLSAKLDQAANNKANDALQAIKVATQ